MEKRCSYVDSIHIDSCIFSSIIQLGDSSFVQSMTRALAVQREAEIFWGNEGDFRKYRVFSEPIHHLPITEQLEVHTFKSPSAILKVKNIDIIAISSSSVVHVGNSNMVQMETRVKHIRHLESVEEKADGRLGRK
jgi:spore germination protein PE